MMKHWNGIKYYTSWWLNLTDQDLLDGVRAIINRLESRPYNESESSLNAILNDEMEEVAKDLKEAIEE